MSKYQDLQKEASALGMEKVVGVSAEELTAFIEEKTGATPKVSSEEIQVESSEPEYNLAIVFDGAREIRRYDVQTHGKSFKKLAQEFAGNRGYRIEMGFLAGKIECPNCGHTFN